VKNNLMYYNMHDLGYTFGDMIDLTPLQILYLAKASQYVNEEREKRRENRQNSRKGGARKNLNTRSELKKKYKNRQKSRQL